MMAPARPPRAQPTLNIQSVFHQRVADRSQGACDQRPASLPLLRSHCTLIDYTQDPQNKVHNRVRKRGFFLLVEISADEKAIPSRSWLHSMPS